jgi:hypothetical protein
MTYPDNSHFSSETTESAAHESTEESVSPQHLSVTTESYTTTKYSTASENTHSTSDPVHYTADESTAHLTDLFSTAEKSEQSTTTTKITSSRESSLSSLLTSTIFYSTSQTENSPETAFSSGQTTQPASHTSTENVITTQEYTEVKQISNGTVKCICVCRQNNHTLEETMELRKRELLEEKTKLSSTVRKLTSAPDVRESSAVMGKLGVALIITTAGLLTLVDICSVSLFIYNVLKQHILNVI